MQAKPILIVLYYWPPAGGPGVQRWLKFAKYLPEWGYHPIIAYPKGAAYPIIDKQLLSEIPNDISLIEIPITEPLNWLKKMGLKSAKTFSQGVIKPKSKQTLVERLLWWMRANFFIPDARVTWISTAVKHLDAFLTQNKVDTLITTGPPHSLHLIGQQLKAKHKLRWIADFRDPWTSIGYHAQLPLTHLAKQKHQRLEKQVLESADLLLVTSKGTAKEFKDLTSTPIQVITNGFDIPINTQLTDNPKFSLAHIGSFLSERNPKGLWRVLSELTKNEDFARDLQLDFAGIVSPEIEQTLKAFGLSSFVCTHGYLSHEQAIALQRQAQVLLLIEIDAKETASIIPGKLFEYMASGRPILALGPNNSDIADLLLETQSGVFFNYQQEEALKKLILQWYALFKEGGLSLQPKSIDKFSRKNLTKQLADILNQI